MPNMTQVCWGTAAALKVSAREYMRTACPRATGRRTDLADGMLLCSWHHHHIHDDRYLVQTMPTGGVRFHRRT